MAKKKGGGANRFVHFMPTAQRAPPGTTSYAPASEMKEEGKQEHLQVAHQRLQEGRGNGRAAPGERMIPGKKPLETPSSSHPRQTRLSHCP